MTRRVVITGVGAITPLGVGSDALIGRWSAGECGIEDGVGRCRDHDLPRSRERRLKGRLFPCRSV